MPLILIDGGEDGASWVPILSTSSTARNGKSLNVPWSSTPTFIFPPANESATVTMGFAIRTNQLGGGTFLTLRSDGAGTSHVALTHESDGTILIHRSPTPNVLATAPQAVPLAETWYHMEVQVVLHDTTGSVKLRINENLVAQATNVDTKNAGTKSVFDSVRFGRTNGAGGVYYIDDLYVMSGDGDTFLGDCVVETLYPNGNGTVNEWIGSDGNSTDNYLLVDEPQVPSTSDYVSSGTAGQRDLYTLGNLVRTEGQVLGVTHCAYSAKNDAGARSIKVLNQGAGAVTSSPAVILSTTYGPAHMTLPLNPDTSALWTMAEVNALQTGVEVV